MANIVCGTCGAQAASDDKFCTTCGAVIPEVQSKQPDHDHSLQQGQANLQPQAAAQPVAQPAVQLSAQPQPVYAPPLQQAAVNTAPMSVFKYVLAMLAFSVPILGIVLAFMWAFGTNTGPGHRNFARAQLIFWGLIVLVAILAFVFGGELVMEFGTNIK